MRPMTLTKVIHLNMLLRVVRKDLKRKIKPLMNIALKKVLKATKRPQAERLKAM